MTDIDTGPDVRLERRRPLGPVIDVSEELERDDRVLLKPHERLVRSGDELGIFVPLTGDDQVRGTGDQALEARLGVLRKEVLRLEARNRELEKQVEVAVPGRSPDDFSAAVARAVDVLATRMGSLDNPTSDFAVREFSLEAQVAVDLNPLGQMEYRFPRLGEQVDPGRLSKVSMRLVPVPRDVPGEEPSSAPAPVPLDVGVEEVHGIGGGLRRQLAAHGVHTVRDLLAVGTRARTALELEGLLGVERTTLVGWLAQAELLTLPAMDGRTAHLLVVAGYAGLVPLAQAGADDVVQEYDAAAARLADALGPPRPLDAQTVRGWQDAARHSRLAGRLRPAPPA